MRASAKAVPSTIQARNHSMRAREFSRRNLEFRGARCLSTVDVSHALIFMDPITRATFASRHLPLCLSLFAFTTASATLE